MYRKKRFAPRLYMGAMDVISLDDTADTSIFIIDEEPILDHGVAAKRRRGANKKKIGKKGNVARGGVEFRSEQKKSYVVMGGVISDEIPPRRGKKRKSLETIVIEDEDSVIELSDDEVGVIGGELSASMGRVQRLLDSFQAVPPHRPPPAKLRSPNLPEQSSAIDTCPKKPLLPTPHKASAKRKLRPIVIDGSNVAFGHGDSRRQFSSRGIEICAQYFLSRGHTVKVFVPQFRRRHVATLDTHILDKLEEDKILVYTPSRHVNGKTIASYDDRMMVEYAAQCGAVIVTRDNLRDLASESEVFQQVIYERLLMFTWVDDEVIMFPQDPLGRNGPVLDDFLAFPPEQPEGESSKVADDKKKT